MTRGATSLLIAGILLSSVAAARGAITPELVQRGKAATALVEIRTSDDKTKGFGSAFCVDPGGLFVTNAHVAEAVKDARLTLVLSPGEKTQRLVKATVLKSDKNVDLALLLADLGDGPPLPALELGQSDALAETMEVAAFGYPFGDALTFDNNGYPSVSVNTGRITALRKKEGELELVQVDAALNPGNSGGPVLDANGRVIGIVISGLRGAGINFAIPVNRLKKVADKPIVLVRPGEIPYTGRHNEQLVTVRVASFTGPLTGYTVDLALTGDGAPRTLSGPLVNGVFATKFVPLVKSAAGARSVAVSARFADGSVIGHLTDRAVKVGSTSVNVSAIGRIERKDGTPAVASVTLADGKELAGTITGLETSQIALGGGAVATVDLSKATSITVGEAEQSVQGLAYRVAVKLKGVTTAESSGSIGFSGAPVAPAAPVIAAAPSKSNPVSRGGADAPVDIMSGGMPMNTPLAGGNGGGEFSTKQDPPRDVVGFKYSVAEWAGRPVMRELVPLYSTAANDIPATKKPDLRHRENEGVILAKDGYVVGGVMIDSDDCARGVKVIFMRLVKGKPNPADQYTSDWIGRPSSGQRPKLIAGHGERVVGVCGRKGMNCDALGLVIIP